MNLVSEFIAIFIAFFVTKECIFFAHSWVKGMYIENMNNFETIHAIFLPYKVKIVSAIVILYDVRTQY